MTDEQIRELAYKLLVEVAGPFHIRRGGQSWKFVLAARKVLAEYLQ